MLKSSALRASRIPDLEFALIELLVIVETIAILAVILFPVSGRQFPKNPSGSVVMPLQHG